MGLLFFVLLDVVLGVGFAIGVGFGGDLQLDIRDEAPQVGNALGVGVSLGLQSLLLLMDVVLLFCQHLYLRPILL
eukprot:596744-Pyramimonas_sp.AAC.1